MTAQRGHKLKSKRDPDFIGAESALRRAGQKARDIARRSGGYVVVYRNGIIVKERLVDQTEKSGKRRKKTD